MARDEAIIRGALAYLKRYDDPGYVYIAGSLSARVVKIGTSINIRQRERKLRFDGDGGINDWKILFSVWVENGGRSEDRALTQLSKFRRSRSFFKDGVQQNATEILDCSFSVAFNAVRSVVGEDLMSKAWTSIYHRRYDFE